MKDYKEEKKDLEDFISGSVKELSKDNKEKVNWLIQGMLLAQGKADKKLLSVDVAHQ
mgnify:CR=1 FL=1